MKIETNGLEIHLTLSSEETRNTATAIRLFVTRWPEVDEERKLINAASVLLAAAYLVETNKDWGS